MNNFNKESSMPMLGRAAIGSVLGGLAGRAYGDSKSDGALSGRLAGTVAGAVGGGLAGLGVHGARKLMDPSITKGVFSSGNVLTGLIGAGAAVGSGLGATHLASKSSPNTFRPDYITEHERAENLRIKALADAYKSAGGNFGRMDVANAQALKNYINDPKFNTRAMIAIRGPEAVSMGSKHASYYQPTDMDLTNAAYHTELRRALALRQLMAMQQMQQQQQQQQPSLQHMGSANSPEEAANKIRGIIQSSQQPSEEQARAMINQYMGATGVDTSSDGAQAAAEKYDSAPAQDRPARKSRPKQKPVKIKSKVNSNKTASMSLSDVQMLEKVAGDAYPTYYHRDGSVTKDINGMSHTFSPSGILKTSSALDYLKNPKVVAGILGVGALGYGGKKLHDYMNRDTRSRGERVFDAGKAALPHLIASYKAYNAMKDQVARAADPSMPVGPVDPQVAAMSGNQPIDPRMLPAPADLQQSQFDPRMDPRAQVYQPIPYEPHY